MTALQTELIEIAEEYKNLGVSTGELARELRLAKTKKCNVKLEHNCSASADYVPQVRESLKEAAKVFNKKM
jgi:hypothetical protein